MELKISSKKYLYLFIFFSISLVFFSGLVNVIRNYGYLESEFGVMIYKNLSVDKERNIPTFFSSANILFAAVLMIICYFGDKRNITLKYGWILLSILFLFLSFDEITEVHEYFASFMRRIGIGNNDLFYYSVWTIPYIILGLSALLFLGRFLLKLPKYLLKGYLFSGGLFITGAIGIEIVSHFFDNSQFIYVILSSLEEFFEMIGFIFFIYYTIVYFEKEFGQINLRFKEEDHALNGKLVSSNSMRIDKISNPHHEGRNSY